MTNEPGSLRRRTLTWELFLAHVLRDRLAETGVAAGEVAAIVGDIERRALHFAASGRAARRALKVPFLDDVAEFEPRVAPVGVKADTAVVVRTSILEDSHASDAVDAAALFDITYLASQPLNVWLHEHANTSENDPPVGTFAELTRNPRAYAGLQALALASEDGGRRAFRMPDASQPSTLSVSVAAASPVRTRRSGLAAIDKGLLGQLGRLAAGEVDVLFTSSLSRFSRDSVLLASVVEFALAHGGAILTTNFLLRPGEAFARRPPLIAAIQTIHWRRLRPSDSPALTRSTCAGCASAVRRTVSVMCSVGTAVGHPSRARQQE